MGLKEERLGQIFTNRCGTKFIIVEYNNCNDVVVEFQDEHKHRTHTDYRWCVKGSVDNPYDKTVYNIGYRGVTSFKRDSREYVLWSDMLRRCYAVENRNKTYKQCIVCDRWLCFANFCEDLPYIDGYDFWKSNPNQKIALDKDIKGDSTIYSLETCSFVSISENSKERQRRNPSATKPIIGINIKDGTMIRFSSTSEINKDPRFSRSSVIFVCDGKYSQHKGYKWYWENDFKEACLDGFDKNK